MYHIILIGVVIVLVITSIFSCFFVPHEDVVPPKFDTTNYVQKKDVNEEVKKSVYNFLTAAQEHAAVSINPDKSVVFTPMTLQNIPLQEQIINACGNCDDSRYAEDCKYKNKTYTCAAMSWQDFGRKGKYNDEYTKSDTTNDDPEVKQRAPQFNSTATNRAYILCPEQTCRTSLESFGKTAHDLYEEIVDKVDENLRSKTIIASSMNVVTSSPNNSVFGMTSDNEIIAKKDGKVLDDTEFTETAMPPPVGVWVYGPYPSGQWIKWLNGKGYGISGRSDDFLRQGTIEKYVRVKY